MGDSPDLSALVMLCHVACAESEKETKKNKNKRPFSSVYSSSSSTGGSDRVYPPTKWVIGRRSSRTVRPSSSSSLASTSRDEPYKKMKRIWPKFPSSGSSTGTDDEEITAGLERSTAPAGATSWREALARMGGTTVPLHFGAKSVTATDLSRSANRFLVTRDMQSLLGKTLSVEEKGKVWSNEGLLVTVLDGAGRSYELTLKVWSSHNWIVLNGRNYMKFIKASRLSPCDRLHLWVFRRGDRPQRSLCLALACS